MIWMRNKTEQLAGPLNSSHKQKGTHRRVKYRQTAAAEIKDWKLKKLKICTRTSCGSEVKPETQQLN